MRQPTRRAFTLVELLVVITVIGILMGLLLPAIQMARESGRSATCMNNVKQLAMACLTHESTHTYLPTGGWAWGWAGDPDRGFGIRQPGGWLYNILPYMEQGDLYDIENHPDNESDPDGAYRASMPVEAFLCPTRHTVKTYPYNSAGSFNSFHNIETPVSVGRCDYAANAGDLTADPESSSQTPNTDWDGAGADQMSEEDWKNREECRDARYSTGVIFRRSKTTLGHVSVDGESNTYLIGERYLAPEKYEGQNGFYETMGMTDDHNDQAWDMGYDYENTRWTRKTAACTPMRDRGGHEQQRAFGSAHSAGFHMALCDGSVHRMDFNIDQETHRRLGNRKDGGEVDHSEFID